LCAPLNHMTQLETGRLLRSPRHCHSCFAGRVRTSRRSSAQNSRQHVCSLRQSRSARTSHNTSPRDGRMFT
jgi:hypothetical protein